MVFNNKQQQTSRGKYNSTLVVNTDMSKVIFTSVIVPVAVVAAILSLCDCYRFPDDGGTGGNSSPSGDDSSQHQPQQVGKIPDYSQCSSGSS